jgi:hypothetical protein
LAWLDEKKATVTSPWAHDDEKGLRFHFISSLG